MTSTVGALYKVRMLYLMLDLPCWHILDSAINHDLQRALGREEPQRLP